MHKMISLLFWDVRGLDQDDKCEDVLMELINASPSIVRLQETKLSSLSLSKARSFLPSRLFAHITKDADGASGVSPLLGIPLFLTFVTHRKVNSLSLPLSHSKPMVAPSLTPVCTPPLSTLTNCFSA